MINLWLKSKKQFQLVRLTCCLLFFCYLGDFNILHILPPPTKTWKNHQLYYIINCTILPILVCKASFKIQRLLIVHLNPYTLNHQGQPEECFFSWWKKSQGQPPGMVLKPCKWWDFNYLFLNWWVYRISEPSTVPYLRRYLFRLLLFKIQSHTLKPQLEMTHSDGFPWKTREEHLWGLDSPVWWFLVWRLFRLIEVEVTLDGYIFNGTLP